MQMPQPKGASRGLIVIISGPSGSGKTTICSQLLKDLDMVWSISVTTREPRPNEKSGVDYTFLSEEAFEQWVARNKLVEHAQVFGHWYGTPREPLERALREGMLYLMEVDVVGGESVRRAFPDDCVYIFVKPLSFAVLKERFECRRADTPEQIARGLKRFKEEMQHADRYDWEVVNDDLTEAVEEVKKLIRQTQERRGAQ